MASEVERLRAELSAAEKVEELIAAKEAHDGSEESLARIKALKAEVSEMRREVRKDRVPGAVAVQEGDGAVTPEPVEAGVGGVN